MSIGNARPRSSTATGARAKPTSSGLPSPLPGFRLLRANRFDVRADRTRRHQLHDYLPPLSRRRRCLRQRASSQPGHFDRRCVSAHRRLSGNGGDQRSLRLSASRPAASGKFAALAMLIIGLLNLLGLKQTGGLAFLISIPTAIVVVVLGLFQLTAHRRSTWSFTAVAREHLAKLGRVRRNRAR